MKMMPIYAATAAVLLSTTAMAQTPAPAPTTPQASPTSPAMPDAGAANSGAMGSTAATANNMPTGYVTRQAPDQHMASNLIGTNVRGPGDENLGEINDLLVDRSGNVSAVVIGVGGFLGIGQKDVAVPFQSVEVTRVDGSDRLVLRQTRDQLKNAPTFTELDTTPATTGSVNTTRPATPPATTAPAAR